MITFSLFTESQLQWNGNPKIGWWEDQDPIIVYHGTHKKHLESVLKDGLTRKDPVTGFISLALEPNTAFGYAAMSGEAEFRAAGAKSVSVPPSDRVVFVFKIPKSWIMQHYDKNLSGNVGTAKKHMNSKEEYEKFKGNDNEYYSLAELRVNVPVPAKFITGYMKK